jgi:hypothetical protein
MAFRLGATLAEVGLKRPSGPSGWLCWGRRRSAPNAPPAGH